MAEAGGIRVERVGAVREWRVQVNVPIQVDQLPAPDTPIWKQTRSRYHLCEVTEDGRMVHNARAVWRQVWQNGGGVRGFAPGPTSLCNMHKKEGEVKDDFNI